MLRVVFLFAFLFSSSLFAQETYEVKYNYVSSQSAYACSYAERQFKSFVKEMGGVVASARCTGGLPDFFSLRLVGHIAAPAYNEDNVNWVRVNIRGNESCEFNKKMVLAILPAFEVRNLEVRDNCWDSQGRYSFSFDVAN